MKNLNILPCILLISLVTLTFNSVVAQEKTLELGTFTGVKLGLPVDVHIRQGSPQKVVVKATDQVVGRIKTKIHDGMLYIVKQDNDSGWWEKQKGKGEAVKIYITAPNIKLLATSDGGSIQSENTLRAGRLNVSVSGAGTIKVVVEAGNLESKVTGSGHVVLRGNAQVTTLRISGSGNLNAERLVAKNCQVEISGSGNCRIQVNNDLLSRISGNGKLYYRGNPKRIVNNASGSGILKKID